MNEINLQIINEKIRLNFDKPILILFFKNLNSISSQNAFNSVNQIGRTKPVNIVFKDIDSEPLSIYIINSTPTLVGFINGQFFAKLRAEITPENIMYFWNELIKNSESKKMGQISEKNTKNDNNINNSINLKNSNEVYKIYDF